MYLHKNSQSSNLPSTEIVLFLFRLKICCNVRLVHEYINCVQMILFYKQNKIYSNSQNYCTALLLSFITPYVWLSHLILL